MRWRRGWQAAVAPFLLGRQTSNAWAKGRSAKRKMLAASRAEDREHSAKDAFADWAGQCAARRQARECRGLSFRRRRWRPAARLVDDCPRIAEFHDTILHPHPQTRAPQHPGTRLFFSGLHRRLAWTLSRRTRTGCLCNAPEIIVKVVENCTDRLHSCLAAAILWTSAKRS